MNAKRKLITLIVLFNAACGVEPSGSEAKASRAKDSSQNADKSQDAQAATNTQELNEQQTKVEAFRLTIYPLAREHCVDCHESTTVPNLANNDPQTAFAALVDSQKVSFQNVAKSRIVERLRLDSHNCWSASCEDDAAQMETAINAYIAKVASANVVSEEQFELVTGERAFNEAVSRNGTPGEDTALFLASDFDEITDPMVVADDDPDGEAQEYIHVPDAGADAVGSNNPGSETTYTFEILQTATYAVYGRIKANNGGSNSFHLQVNDGDFFAWATQITGNAWEWSRVVANNDFNQPITVELTEGTHTLTLKQREDGTKINRLAISQQLENFQGAEILGEIAELTFDLEALTGIAATLLVDVEEFDDASKTIKLSNLRIECSEEIYIRDVMPLVNGTFNPQHATFRLVDQTVSPPGATISEAALIIIGDEGYNADKLSFTFGEIR